MTNMTLKKITKCHCNKLKKRKVLASWRPTWPKWSWASTNLATIFGSSGTGLKAQSHQNATTEDLTRHFCQQHLSSPLIGEMLEDSGVRQTNEAEKKPSKHVYSGLRCGERGSWCKKAPTQAQPLTIMNTVKHGLQNDPCFQESVCSYLHIIQHKLQQRHVQATLVVLVPSLFRPGHGGSAKCHQCLVAARAGHQQVAASKYNRQKNLQKKH